MLWRKPPIWLLRALFPKALWRKDEKDSKAVYITFDDGPSSFTRELIAILKEYDQKATFFMLGRQIEAYPDLPDFLKVRGHAIGHHGYSHLDAWKCTHEEFMQDLDKGFKKLDSQLFRPAYGHLSRRQYKELSRSFQIVQWDLMPGDFLDGMDAHDISHFVLTHVRPGSIIVLHDQDKLKSKILECLPLILGGLKQKGLHSEALAK